MVRWLIQTEMAVERSPSQPDYQGLDIVAGTATLPDGRASTAKFTEWVSGRLRDRASIWKQDRLYRQERRMGRVGKGADDDDSDEDDEMLLVDRSAKRRKRQKMRKGRKEVEKMPAVKLMARLDDASPPGAGHRPGHSRSARHGRCMGPI